MTKKKTEYKLEDGSVITASSASEFVTKLRESSKFDSNCTDAEYMKNFAHRQNVTSGAVIRTDTSSNFLDDLKDIGYVS